MRHPQGLKKKKKNKKRQKITSSGVDCEEEKFPVLLIVIELR